MNFDPDFELSADMRLLELQRASLGLAPRNPTAWQSRALAEGSIPVDEPPAPTAPSGALLSVEAVATPSAGVIPGAVVTVSLSVTNDGASEAQEVIARVPLPGGAGYRPGSFVQDGRPADDEAAQRFFGTGLSLRAFPPGARRTFLWKLGVRLGTEALVITPSVSAANAAVVGARTIMVSRKGSSSIGAFAAELERADPALYAAKPLIPVDIPANDLPFYELDVEEQIEHEAVAAALSDAVVRDPQPQPQAAPPAPAPAPAPAPPVQLPTAHQPPREAVVLYGRFDRTTIAFFERTFNGSKGPTILSHCIFASALACATAGSDDSLGLKRHLEAQSQILHRIQLHERLGKKEPIAHYAGELLAQLSEVEPSTVVAPPQPKDTLLLETELSQPSIDLLKRIEDERARWDFVKARQLTLALQAQRAGGSEAGTGAALENALRLYAQTAMTTLQKLFVRLRLDRTTGVLFGSEPQLDASARALLAALSRALDASSER
jgi:hypothetical protein